MTSSVSRPQTCGKKEREWQTLDRWLSARPLAANLVELQRQLDIYDLVFNQQRRQQALGGLTPAQAYQRAEKAHSSPSPLAAPVLREDPTCAIFHDRQLLELFHIDPARRHQPRTRR